jgi:hypothetical protein
MVGIMEVGIKEAMRLMPREESQFSQLRISRNKAQQVAVLRFIQLSIIRDYIEDKEHKGNE